MARRGLARASGIGVFAAVAVACAASGARADGIGRANAELDPLPFVRAGYGVQVGYRPSGSGLRVSVASFALDVPDAAVELGGNEGFHARVRPSAALYVFHYRPDARGGWALGGSLRYLRIRYTHDDEPDRRADVGELSPEIIAGYKWHPGAAGFYLQPWLGLGVTVWRRGDLDVGEHTVSPLPVQPFFTVNLGWELAL